MGLPKWIPTPEILAEVERLSKMGVTEASIARQVGISPSTFSEKKQLHPELAEVLKKGHAKGEELAVSALWTMIQDSKSKGHTTAVLFYLKCKCGWNDGNKQTTEIVAPTGVKFEVIPSGKEE